MTSQDPASDLALLGPVAFKPQAISFSDTESPTLGQDILVASYPLNGQSSGLLLTTGRVRGTVGPKGDTRLVQITAEVQRGAGGLSYVLKRRDPAGRAGTGSPSLEGRVASGVG